MLLAAPPARAQHYVGNLRAGQNLGDVASPGQALVNLGLTDGSGHLLPSLLPAPTTSTLGGVEAVIGAPHEWVSGISAAGVPQLSQPAIGDISGAGALASLGLGSNLTSSGGLLSLTGANVAAALGYTPPDPAAVTITGGSIGGLSSLATSSLTITGNSTTVLAAGGAPFISAPTMSANGVDTIVGLNAGIGLTSGATEGTIIGTYAGGGGYGCAGVQFSGAEDTLVGWHAGTCMTTGSFNTGIGDGAAMGITTGSNNAAVGADALRNALTSTQMTAVGSSAMHDWDGNFNTAVGGGAMFGCTPSDTCLSSGVSNVAIGTNALNSGTTASYDALVGAFAGAAITTGAQDTAVGNRALGALTTANYNAALGAFSGWALTTGGSNTLLGALAGYALTTGSNNILIGWQTGKTTLTTGGGNILIGNNLDTPAADTSNYIDIGGVLTVTGAGTPTTAIGQFSGAWQVGGDVSATDGYQQNGQNALTVSGHPTNPSVLIGPFAGAALPANSFWVTAAGDHSMYSLTESNEDAGLGGLSCYSLTTGNMDTCIGVHAMGAETTASGSVAVGNDSMRNSIGSYASTFVGKSAGRNGSVPYSVGVGEFALQGAGGVVAFSGTLTPGDTITLAFTSNAPAAQVSGLPFSPSHTVAAGDSWASIASAFAAALNGQNITWTGNTGVALMATEVTTPSGSVYLSLDFTGNGSAGLELQMAPAVTGAATETVAYSAAGSSFFNATAVGFNAAGQAIATGLTNSTFVGGNSAPFAVTANNDTITGAYAGYGVTSDTKTTATGAYSGYSLTGGTFGNTFDGFSSGYGVTAGKENTIVGSHDDSAAQGCVTTGSWNIQLGSNSCVQSPTSSYQLSIGDAIYGVNLTGTSGAVSGARIGIDAPAPTAALTIGDAGGGLDDGHVAVLQTTAPTVSGGSLDAHASDVAGTVTEGGAVTGFTLSFGHAWTTAPHCAVSSPTGSTFTSYTVSTTALTLVNPSGSGDQFTYVCVQ